MLQLYLASRSQRRQQILTQLGIHFKCLYCDIDETRLPDEPAEEYVIRLAREKAVAGLIHPDKTEVLPVLAADTTVVIDHELLGKPQNQADASRMLRRLSNNTHIVLSAIAINNGYKENFALSKSIVQFRAISEEEITAYWFSGEPQDKAGAYAVQGLGAIFIKYLAGSYSGVMGLPIFETEQLLKQFCIKLL